MPTYTATFRTADTWATKEFTAATAQEALDAARQQHAADANALDWCSYDPSSVPLDEIEIDGPDGSGVVWQSDDLALRLVAGELREALQLALVALNAATRFRIPGRDTDSYAVAARCARVLAKVPLSSI